MVPKLLPFVNRAISMRYVELLYTCAVCVDELLNIGRGRMLGRGDPPEVACGPIVTRAPASVGASR